MATFWKIMRPILQRISSFGDQLSSKKARKSTKVRVRDCRKRKKER